MVARRVLVIDIGGTHVKVLATGRRQVVKIPSGPALTPAQMVASVKKVVADWDYTVVSIGYPGRVLQGRPAAEPRNLGPGWAGLRFRSSIRMSGEAHE